MSSPPVPLLQHAARGAGIRRLLRMALVLFFVVALVAEPPPQNLALCWLLVGCYLIWSLAIYVLGSGDRTARFLWLALFVDVAVLASLTLITDVSAGTAWTPYLIIEGFYLIPVIAAAQLSPAITTAVVVPTVAVHLVSGLIVRSIGQEPLSYALLRTFMLAAVGLGAILLSRLQRSRVATITELVQQRTALLAEMIAIEQREQRNLAESLHDGALQYVLAARQELDELVDLRGAGDASSAEAVGRVDHALTESARLLRGTLSQLHPAVIEKTGLLPALRDVVETVRGRGRFSVELVVEHWPADERTPVDELLLTTARELLGNVARHAAAQAATVRLRRATGADGRETAELRVSDDGRGLGEVDLDRRLAEGHLGLASRRIRIEAAGGTLSLSPGTPRGTVAEVVLPLR